jgi:hypothetical protein
VFTAEMRDEDYEERLRRLNKVKGREAGEGMDETRARRVASWLCSKEGAIGKREARYISLPKGRNTLPLSGVRVSPTRRQPTTNTQHTTCNTQYMAQAACMCGGRGVHLPLITRYVFYRIYASERQDVLLILWIEGRQTEEECYQNDRKEK